MRPRYSSYLALFNPIHKHSFKNLFRPSKALHLPVGNLFSPSHVAIGCCLPVLPFRILWLRYASLHYYIFVLISHNSLSPFFMNQQLWALLHFIMPTLFDSHDEFTEWFSKDIESHAENKSALNERIFSLIFFCMHYFYFLCFQTH